MNRRASDLVEIRYASLGTGRFPMPQCCNILALLSKDAPNGVKDSPSSILQTIEVQLY